MSMNLDEALAVWAYMKNQYKPSAEALRAADEAWRVICEEANKVITRTSPTLSGTFLGGGGECGSVTLKTSDLPPLPNGESR